MDVHLHVFDEYRRARNEYFKHIGTREVHKTIKNQLEYFVNNERHIFTVITTLNDILRVQGMEFKSVKFNGLIDPDARAFVRSRIRP